MGVKKEKPYLQEQLETTSEKKLKNNFKVKSRSKAQGTLSFENPLESAREINDDNNVDYLKVNESTGGIEKLYPHGPEDKEKEEKSLLNIVVQEENRSYKIKASSLEEILTKNKKVKRIVIEDISLDKAQRMEIHVDNRQKSKNTYQKMIAEVEGVNEGEGNLTEIEFKSTQKGKDHQKRRIGGSGDVLSRGPEKVLVDKVELVRNKSRPKNISTYYYRAKEHLDLYQVGMSYLRDIRDNKKCFSFEHLRNREGQQNTILGVSLFLMFHVNRKSLIVTHDFDNSVYSRIMGNKVNKKIIYPAENMGYPVIDCDGIRFIEYIDLYKIMNNLTKTSYEEFIDHLIDTNDTVLIDFPEIAKLELKKEIFFPLINCVDNVSFVVNLNDCLQKDLIKIHNYFTLYEVPIKGVTVSNKA